MGAELRRGPARASLVVGVTQLAWMYSQSREWAKSLLEEWESAQLAGTAPVRVFRMGKRRCLFTTLPVIHATMPPGKDAELYRRMAAVEADVADAHRRTDREVLERKRADADLTRQVGSHRRAG